MHFGKKMDSYGRLGKWWLLRIVWHSRKFKTSLFLQLCPKVVPSRHHCFFFSVFLTTNQAQNLIWQLLSLLNIATDEPRQGTDLSLYLTDLSAYAQWEILTSSYRSATITSQSRISCDSTSHAWQFEALENKVKHIFILHENSSLFHNSGLLCTHLQMGLFLLF